MQPRSPGSPPHPFEYGATCSSSPTNIPRRTLSPRSCSDADDEASSFSSFSRLLMGPSDQDHGDSQHGTSSPSYPGEDTRPTSSKELLGFYAYSFAAEVFVVCALGAFIPITLEDLARQSSSAVLARDHSKPCIATIPDDALPPRALVPRPAEQCIFNFFGAEVNTASFAMYTFSFSVLIQSLLVVTMSGAADHGRYRKTLLLTFAVIGAFATMSFIYVTPSIYLLGSVWAIIGNVCFGASFVLLNSFLPVLVRHHPKAAAVQTVPETHRTDQVEEEAEPLMVTDDSSTPYPPSPSAQSAEMQLSTKISSYGVGIGYISSAFVQITSIFILQATGAKLFSLRLVLFFIGLWWLVFTAPAAFFLRPRPGPPLVFDNKSGQTRSWLGYILYSWKNLGRTVMRARRLKDVLLFLAAWFMISDAVATVSGTAILFAKTTLGMSSAGLASINVIVLVSGIAGAFTWSKVSRIMQLKPSQTILTCICLFELIPLYALLGYIPAIQRLGYLGLQQQWEVFPVGAVYGLVMGGLSSYCRSLFGELIPPGSEAAFYALYAITDKGSSIFGPAIVGAITDAYGEIRPAFFFLALLIGLPIPIMFLVDVERGKREGAALAREIEGRHLLETEGRDYEE